MRAKAKLAAMVLAATLVVALGPWWLGLRPWWSALLLLVLGLTVATVGLLRGGAVAPVRQGAGQEPVQRDLSDS